ncbi:two-component system chemotaxis sensor kinase CheA [Archangium gephyra]|uniref:Chemotaxis protein CheA n=1 Tax=Archangium gephyra TaxID=48 RepID=A0AAC8TC55_9BACT|nr:chemotaxis protein CheA [Archangium gephyra]AKJ00402.1 Signal transduction histidine kinase CheA [Archangium gephyra]REG32898.1 two-component system chemotaxis sensor kinase CheA [Archangium gephyra]
MQIDHELIIESFRTETEELFAEMEAGLLSFEAHPREEVLQTVFRGAHTLKGLAMSLRFPALTDFVHGVEDVLEALLERRRLATGELVTLLLSAVDHLRGLTAAAVSGSGQERMPAGAQRLLEQLRAPGLTGPLPVGAQGAPEEARRVRTLRVDVEKLDRIANLTGELSIARGRLTQVLAKGSAAEALGVHLEAERLHLELQEEVNRVRMVPVGPLFRQNLRAVRELTGAQHKRARLVLEGEDVEVDTALVEGLREPLLHLVRNAVDHGLETPEARREAGKEASGRLVLRASHEPGMLVVQLSDDGRGLRYERLREKARALGRDAERMTAEELAELVFLPGLSTAETVTEVSGRGMGMDVVRRAVDALRGTVTLLSEEGRGTTVTLRVPLTLASIQGFAVGIGEETYVLPLETVQECLELPAELRGQPGGGVLNLRGQALPYLRLSEVLGVRGSCPERESVVVVAHGGGLAGLVVDELYGEGQRVLKPLDRLLHSLPGVSGSTLLDDGRVGLVLDVPSLLKEAVQRTEPGRTSGGPAPRAP